MDKKQRGAFYTTNKDTILADMQHLVKGKDVVDLYCGDGDLLYWANNHGARTNKGYDIVETAIVSQGQTRNTILDSPRLEGKFLVVNPPYLGRNKATDKTDFIKYGVNDRYKCAMLSMIESGAEEGIIIIPANFWCDEDGTFRQKIFGQWSISHVTIFQHPVFEDTPIRVTAFAFQKGKTTHLGDEPLVAAGGYKVGKDWFDYIANPQHTFTRLLNGSTETSKITLYASDTGGSKRIAIKYGETYHGKVSDRNKATLVPSIELTDVEALQLCKLFNDKLEGFREQYADLFLTNFLASKSERKRLGFKLANALLSNILTKEMGK